MSSESVQDLVDLGPRLDLDLVHRHGRASVAGNDARADAEVAERALQCLAGVPLVAGVAGRGRSPPQQVERRERVAGAARADRQPDLLGLVDLDGVRLGLGSGIGSRRSTISAVWCGASRFLGPVGAVAAGAAQPVEGGSEPPADRRQGRPEEDHDADDGESYADHHRAERGQHRGQPVADHGADVAARCLDRVVPVRGGGIAAARSRGSPGTRGRTASGRAPCGRAPVRPRPPGTAAATGSPRRPGTGSRRRRTARGSPRAFRCRTGRRSRSTAPAPPAAPGRSAPRRSRRSTGPPGAGRSHSRRAASGPGPSPGTAGRLRAFDFVRATTLPPVRGTGRVAQTSMITGTITGLRFVCS